MCQAISVPRSRRHSRSPDQCHLCHGVKVSDRPETLLPASRRGQVRSRARWRRGVQEGSDPREELIRSTPMAQVADLHMEAGLARTHAHRRRSETDGGVKQARGGSRRARRLVNEPWHQCGRMPTLHKIDAFRPNACAKRHDFARRH